MNLVQFKRHDADSNLAHVSMVEPSGIGDDTVTDIGDRRPGRARARSRPGTHQGRRRQTAA